MEHFDVIIIGAGLSGVGGACHLKRHCPGKRFVILEGREAMGGTWDLFRYPGVRSDSDMYTLGYRFRPWRENKAMADGPSILNYIRETASEYNIDKAIRYNHRVRRISWSSADARWTSKLISLRATQTKHSSGSRATSSTSAPVTTITKAATHQTGRAWRNSKA